MEYNYSFYKKIRYFIIYKCYNIFFTLEIFYIIFTSWYNKQNLSVLSLKKLRIAIKQYNIIHITLLKASMEHKHKGIYFERVCGNTVKTMLW